MRRSSKAIHETAAAHAVWGSGAAPDPWARMAIELRGGEAGGVGDVGSVGQRDTSEGFAAEDAPPALNEVQPGGPNRDEGVLNAWVARQPVANRATAVAGQVIGDEIERAVGIGLVERLEQIQVASGVA